jgi:serine/threonine protein kinase/tetratricopeptide (TPR) repeat protein
VTPETERAALEWLRAKGLVPEETIHAAGRERDRRVREGARAPTLLELLCEARVLDRRAAAGAVRAVRAERTQGAVATLPLAPPPPGPPKGQPILGPGGRIGPYEILSELGRGGMGVVYRARDVKLRREVALKTIAGAVDAEATERFVREARAAARLKHPGIVQVLGVETANGVCAVALELVEGGSLASRLKKDGPLAPHDAAALVRDVARAVHEAHREGIVHRDLKPANVLLDREGNTKLADFGLARDDKLTGITATGDVLGTPAYMAPEQAQANPAAMGPRTDVYGLGAILYETLAGEPPFRGPSGLAVLRRVLEEEAASPSVARVRRGKAPVPRDLETVCLRALEKRPERRFVSAEDMARDLERFVLGEPVRARPLGALERTWRRLRRSNRLALSLAAALALLAAFVLGSVLVHEAREARLKVADEQRNRAAAHAFVEHAVAEIGSLERAASFLSFDPEDLEPRLALIASATSLVDQGRDVVAIDSAVGSVVLRANIFIVRQAIRALSYELGRYVLGDARRNLEFATEAQRAEFESLQRRCGRALGAARRHYAEGLAYRLAHQDKDAEAAFTRAFEADPDDIGILESRGVARQNLGDLPGARADFERVLELEPRWTHARGRLAGTLQGLGETERALQEAERCVAQKHTVVTLFNRGCVRSAQGDREGAIADLEAAIRLSPQTLMAGEARRVLAQLRATGN